jgi:EmrB/QacA subfamily drug resistance transporter
MRSGPVSTSRLSRLDTGPGPARSQRLRLALILVAAFMVVLDFSIVNVALPSIERELGLGAATVQWVITGYAIAFGGLLVLGGRAADLFGRRRMFVAGLLIFTAASLAGGLARDPVLLIASRAVQGAGAAIVAPAALSLITTSVPEGHRRTRALGMYGATSSIGFVAGQVLGGMLVEFTSWRAVFLVNVPVGILAAILAPRLLRDSRGPAGKRRLDVRGALLVTAAAAAMVFAVSEGNTAGWLSPVILIALATAAACAAAFFVAERRHPDPLLPAALLRRPALRTAGTMNLLLGLWNGGELLVLSLYFQQVLKDSPLSTGLAIAPQGIIGFTAGAFGARLAGRIGVRRVLVITGAIASAGFLVLTRMPATGHYSPLFAAVMLVGFGTAGTAFGTMVIATTGVAGAEQGVVGGVINTSRQIGAAIGAATLPAIAAAVSHDAVTATATGTRAAMLAGAAAAAAAATVAWLSRNAASAVTPAARAAIAAAPPAAAAAVMPMTASAVTASRLTASGLGASARAASPQPASARPASALRARRPGAVGSGKTPGTLRPRGRDHRAGHHARSRRPAGLPVGGPHRRARARERLSEGPPRP